MTVLGLLVTACALGGGCSDAQMDSFAVNLFKPRRTPEQNFVAAFASEDADLRRDALAKVAKSKKHDRDWAIKGYVATALLDTDAQARCVALRALQRTGDPRAVETALKLLNYREYPPREVRPPGPLCRWDATELLAKLSEAGNIPEEHRERVRTTLADRLRDDTERHVRIAAARGLDQYPHEASVEALIDGLRDQDFAVVHQCEESLVRLTGFAHHCEALAWTEWLEQHRSDLFAHANEVPESRRPPYRNRVEKIGYDFKQFVRWLIPGRKEK